MKARLTFTLPPTMDDLNPPPLYTLPVDFDPDRAENEGYSTGFHTLSGCTVAFEVWPEDNSPEFDPDPRKVVSNTTPHPRKVHLTNGEHDCTFTLCGNLPVRATRRRYRHSDPTEVCVPCAIRASGGEWTGHSG